MHSLNLSSRQARGNGGNTVKMELVNPGNPNPRPYIGLQVPEHTFHFVGRCLAQSVIWWYPTFFALGVGVPARIFPEFLSWVWGGPQPKYCLIWRTSM